MPKSSSRSPGAKKKEKKDKKHKKERKRSESREQRSRSSYRRQEKDQRKKEKKDKSRRKYQRDESQQRSRSRDNKIKDQSHPRQQKIKQPVTYKSNEMDEEQRAMIIAQRKVRARLLKFNQISDDSSEDQQKAYTAKKPDLPANMPSVKSTPGPTSGKKKESKWGKTASSQPSVIHNTTEAQNRGKDQKSNLQLIPHEKSLELSEDKSIDYVEEEHHDPQGPLEPIDEEYIDPLDQFMQDIEGEAAPQMEVSLKKKTNVISYDQIVTSTSMFITDDYSNMNQKMIAENEEQVEKDRKNFLQAISKLDETKKEYKVDERGILMENNEDNKDDAAQFNVEKEPELDFFAKQRKMAERKELAQVDHSKIEYNEVRFNLYREAEQVKNYDPKDVQKYRKQAGDIKARGKDLLNPVFNWYHCGYSDKVLNIIERRQYKKPFPIQAQSMPLLLSGRDVIGVAETGSGKTLAYLLPVLRHIQDQKRVEEGEGPISIIMTPTRELARQVYLQAKTFGKSLGIRVIACYGGQSVQNQIADFKQGAQLVVCTPGRMIDMLTLNKGKVTNLRRVTFVIIDEADRMFDLGFEPQITRVVDNVRPFRQIALFSATFPRNVQTLARKILNKPVEIIVGSRGQACHNVEQVIEVREQTSKLWRLLQILGNWNDKGSILIFVDKQTEADYLFQELLKYGYSSLVLHGAMDPDDREFTIYDFKKGVLNIMIATSVCARGLDIPSIVLVINFKCPNHLEDYIHRIGRTGRGGNRGTAITFITPPEEQYSIDLLKALQMAQINPPQDLIKLSQTFLGKVKKGEARKIRNRNIQGTGFKFDEDEEERNTQIKDMIKKQMKSEGLGFSDSEDDDIEVKKKKEEDIRGRSHQERIAQAIKNPEIKSKLLSEAVKAVSQAIKQGSAITTEKLLEIAVGKMKEAVVQYNVAKSDGVEQVTKLINQFANSKQGGEGPDFFSYDFEINDYPLGARQKACSQGFLQGIQHQTNCSISLRGVFVQLGKKVPIGCRKLYLHIQGENKYYVTQAYKQIKQVLEESAYENMHMGLAPGKYTV